jgi:sulfatase modifying factor 1
MRLYGSVLAMSFAMTGLCGCNTGSQPAAPKADVQPDPPKADGLRAEQLVGNWRLVRADGKPPAEMKVNKEIAIAKDGTWSSAIDIEGVGVLNGGGTWSLADGTITYTNSNDGKKLKSRVSLTAGRLVLEPDFQLTRNDGKKTPITTEYERQKPKPPAYVPVPLGEQEAKKLQADWAAKSKLPVEATSKMGVRLILIPPAGAALPEPYYLGKYEVTQGEWVKVMGYNPSEFKKVAGQDTTAFPVEHVCWYDCVAFCNQLSEKEGLKPYYELKVIKKAEDGNGINEAEVKILGGSGYHIPTGPEWEHGCRAGTTTKYYFGDKDEDLGDYAWYGKNSGGRPHEVGGKKPNAFGLYDMHGNVYEWNEEVVKADNNPFGPPRPILLGVSRGGSWEYPDADECKVGFQYRWGPGIRMGNIGLRLAQVPSGEAPGSK